MDEYLASGQTSNFPKTDTPPSIMFYGEGGEPLFTIKPDGEIVRGRGFTTEDKMSLRFWELIAVAFPIFLKMAREQ